jgi:hypothetical protein
VRRVTDTELQAAAYSSVTGRVICTVNRPVSFKKKPARITGETGRFTEKSIQARFEGGNRNGSRLQARFEGGNRNGSTGNRPGSQGFREPWLQVI